MPTRVKRRLKYLLNKLGYNPSEYGFKFEFLLNTRSAYFAKVIGTHRILLSLDSFYNKGFMKFHRNNYIHEILSSERLLTEKEFDFINGLITTGKL